MGVVVEGVVVEGSGSREGVVVGRGGRRRE